jgi:PadR family transcriptional regulator, regulatory protein PadR
MAPNPLVQGTLDMLILRSLQWGPQHGYALAETIRVQSSDVLRVETGSLYPALHRLETRGLVRAEWRQSDAKQRARYYRLTPKGRKHLAQERARWSEMVEAIGRIMNPELAKD